MQPPDFTGGFSMPKLTIQHIAAQEDTPARVRGCYSAADGSEPLEQELVFAFEMTQLHPRYHLTTKARALNIRQPYIIFKCDLQSLWFHLPKKWGHKEKK
jgi:hypothetical protein